MRKFPDPDNSRRKVYDPKDSADRKVMATVGYIRSFGLLNGLKPSEFTINGVKVMA